MFSGFLMDSAGSWISTMANSCENYNKLSHFLKGEEFLQRLNNYQLPKKRIN
jgi:hypothetical protein